MVLLLIAGVDLVACELVSPESCEMAGAPGGQSGSPDDACLCCCSHIVVGPPLRLEPTEEALRMERPPAEQIPSYETASIYHPPKA